MEELNVLHSYQRGDPSKEEIRRLVKEKMRVPELSYPLSKDIEDSLLDATMIHKLFSQQGIIYLHHHLDVSADGVYDDRTSGGSLAVVDRTRVTDISLKLIE